RTCRFRLGLAHEDRVTWSGGGVDGRGGDATALDARLAQDRIVRAVVDERLDCRAQRLGQLGGVLRHDVPVRGGVVDLTDELQRAVALQDGVGADRRVGEHGVVLAGHYRRGRLLLTLVLPDGDLLLAGVDARLRLGGDVL